MQKSWIILICAFLSLANASGKKAADIVLPETISEKTFKLSDVKEKIILVDFWATWCKPCAKTLPLLVDLEKKYKGQVKVVLVNIDNDNAKAQKFLKQKDIPLLSVWDKDKKIVESYEVAAMPSLYLLSQGREVLWHLYGYTERDKKDLQKKLKELVGKK